MKTFSQFMSESGGSPYQPYKPVPQPEPSAPPPGWKEKYLEPLKKPPVKLAKAIKEDLGRTQQYQQERKERRRPAAIKAGDRDLAKLTYMLNLDRPGR